MRIPCPFCGSRDSGEFVYRGDATPARPALGDDHAADHDDAMAAMVAYLYPRDNPIGPSEGHWYHAQGCRSWLVVARDTLTHEILGVRLAAPAAGADGPGRAAADAGARDTGAGARDTGARA